MDSELIDELKFIKDDYYTDDRIEDYHLYTFDTDNKVNYIEITDEFKDYIDNLIESF